MFGGVLTFDALAESGRFAELEARLWQPMLADEDWGLGLESRFATWARRLWTPLLAAEGQAG